MLSIPSILHASRSGRSRLGPFALMALLFVGCSFGSDPPNAGGADSSDGTERRTGWFIDSGVEGLSLLIAGDEFVTEAGGAFEYRAGDVVEFLLGDIPLGSVRVPSSGIVTPLQLFGMSVGDPLAFLVPMCAFIDGFCPEFDHSVDLSDEELAVFVMVVILVNVDADDDWSNGIQITAEQRLASETLFLDFTDRSGFRILNDGGILDRDEIEGLFAAIINPLRTSAGLSAIPDADVLPATWDAIVHFHGSLVSLASDGDWIGSLHASGDPGDHIMYVTARLDAFGRLRERFTFHDFPPAGRIDGRAVGQLSFDGSASNAFDARVDLDPDAVGASADEVVVTLEGEAGPYVVRGRWDIEVDGQGGFESGDFWLDPSGVGGNALLHVELSRPGDRIRITGGSNDRRVYGFSYDESSVLSVPVQIAEGMYLRFAVTREGGSVDDIGECRVYGNHIARREMTVFLDPSEQGDPSASSLSPFVRCSIF